MATSRQKRPEPRRKAQTPPPPHFIVRAGSGALSATGAFVNRYPRAVMGLGIFVVVYSFVGANALWYQHGHHPAPMLATRMIAQNDSVKLALADKAAPDAESNDEPGVTTFRITRETETGDDQTQAAKADPLVKAIQQALADKGAYDGVADGVMGPKTSAAILFYEETERLDLTGKPSQTLLRHLTTRSKPSSVAVVPQDRYGDVTASVKSDKPLSKVAVKSPAGAEDDVAGLINDANDIALPDKPDPKVKTIQKGLAKFLDKGIAPDGLMGDRTRQAIRRFQKAYKLTVDGEPSDAVLKKLKSIGMI